MLPQSTTRSITVAAAREVIAGLPILQFLDDSGEVAIERKLSEK